MQPAPTNEDTKRFVESANTFLGDGALESRTLDRVFESNWPWLASEIGKIPAAATTGSKPREDRELLEEVLGIVRGLAAGDGSSASGTGLYSTEGLYRALMGGSVSPVPSLDLNLRRSAEDSARLRAAAEELSRRISEAAAKSIKSDDPIK